MQKRIPVTVLSGFPGAGKNTLLNHGIHNKNNLKVVVIANDMSGVTIDARMVQSENPLSGPKKTGGNEQWLHLLYIKRQPHLKTHSLKIFNQ